MTPQTRIYAVGDVHGMFDQLRETVSWIEDDSARAGLAAHVVFLGDYVDRGEASPDVLDFLAAGPGRSHDVWTCLMGDHDRMMLEALSSPSDVEARETWLANGGYETLEGYGIDRYTPFDEAAAAVPSEHVAFLRGLRPYHATQTHIFVHAGLRPGTGIQTQSFEDMLSIRGPFLDVEVDHGRIVVHGHTPAAKGPDLLPHRINLDTGCYATGRLTCAAFDSDGLRIFSTAPFHTSWAARNLVEYA